MEMNDDEVAAVVMSTVLATCKLDFISFLFYGVRQFGLVCIFGFIG